MDGGVYAIGYEIGLTNEGGGSEMRTEQEKVEERVEEKESSGGADKGEDKEEDGEGDINVSNSV